MGGLGWDFTFDERDRPVLDAMRAAGSRRAAKLSLRWSSSIRGSVCYVTVDGRWPRISLLIARLGRDLPVICEAIRLPHRSAAEREGLGRSFAHIAAQMMYGDDANHEEDWIPHLVSRSSPPWESTVFDFRAPDAPDLEGRLQITARMLVDWEFGEVAPEVMLEELATAAELCLKRALHGRYKRQGSFSENVAEADARGMFSRPPLQRLQSNDRPGVPSRDGTAVQVLETLKDARKFARHEARSTAAAWLADWSEAAAIVLEQLAKRAWTVGEVGPDSS